MNDDPSAQGIVECLRMLADEAAALRLDRTLTALLTAMDVCATECLAGEVPQAAPFGATLH